MNRFRFMNTHSKVIVNAMPHARMRGSASGFTDPAGSKSGQRRYATEKQGSRSQRLALQNIEGRQTVKTAPSRSAHKFRLSVAILAWDGDRQINKKIHPEPQGWEESCFIAGSVAKQLQRIFTIFFAKARRKEPQQPGTVRTKSSLAATGFLPP